MSLKQEVQRMMKEIRKHLPSSEIIVSETFGRLGYTSDRINPQQAKERFEELLHHVWCSGRQGLNLAGESPVIPIARFGYVAIPQFVLGNHTSIAWAKRPGCPRAYKWSHRGRSNLEV